MSLGDIRLGETHDIKFCTSVNGVPTALSSGAVAAYVDNGTTEITAGITLTADFDGRTGLNNVRVVATSGNGFAAGTNVDLVLTAGTVGGDSVVGRPIESFSILNRSTKELDAAIATIDDFLDTEIAAILAAVDTEVAAIKTVTDKFDAAQSEPTGVPAANATPLEKLGFLFMAFRNRIDVTASKKQYYDDSGNVEFEKDLSDDGTTYSETELNAP